MARRTGRSVRMSDHAARVVAVGAILRDWSSSPFEHEGACRHGIRAGLCLDGWSWPRADAEAARVVSEALSANGATRPTWEQGQPEWIDELTERTYCAWCGKRMPPQVEPNRNGVSRKYCSKMCLQANADRKARIIGEQRSWAEHVAALAARKKANWEERRRRCKHCGTVFTPNRIKQQYCSNKCAHAGMKRPNKLKYKPCKGCGEPIHPKNGKEWCSRECWYKHGRKPSRPERKCAWCGETFHVRYPSDPNECCSHSCAAKLTQRRRREKREAA